MPFIPHTEQDKQSMLAAIGVKELNELFDEIPCELQATSLDNIPHALSELALNQHVNALSKEIKNGQCFIGAGAYEHHIPAAVWDITSRGEFLTAYTPYQAEASQGTLQLLYEYQTMMASLTGMEVSNASLYDGASALAEAVLMAVRAQKKKQSNCVVLASSLHPFYRETLKTIVSNQNIELIDIPYDKQTGTINIESLKDLGVDFNALVIQQPNFFGCLEQVDQLTDWAHSKGAFVIGCVNPISLALLKPPGQWGEKGADIVCGEGQPLGIPLASGGPYFGFLTCRLDLIRQMPGRLVGRTVDLEGKQGFTLTLQAREQHIRRSKAKSNICTNQGLLVTAATIYMSLMGAEGLHAVAKTCHQNTKYLNDKLLQIPGIKRQFSAPFFHELVLTIDTDVEKLLQQLSVKGFAGGYALKPHGDELAQSLLVCVTETKTKEDLDAFASEIAVTLSEK